MPWGRHRGGYPYPIMLCNITQNAMGQTPGGGVPVSHNALQHYPECHGADTGGGYPARSSRGGTLPGRGTYGYPPPPAGYPPPPPSQVRMGGGYPVRTTEAVLTTRRAVCLLRSRRRTFLLYHLITWGYGGTADNSAICIFTRGENNSYLTVSNKICDGKTICSI